MTRMRKHKSQESEDHLRDLPKEKEKSTRPRICPTAAGASTA